MLSAGIDQAWSFCVFAHGMNIVAGLDSLNYFRPGLSIVASAEDVRRPIPLQIIFDRDKSRARLVRRCVDQAYAREIGQARRRDLRPMFSFVASNENQPVV